MRRILSGLRYRQLLSACVSFGITLGLLSVISMARATDPPPIVCCPTDPCWCIGRTGQWYTGSAGAIDWYTGCCNRLGPQQCYAQCK